MGRERKGGGRPGYTALLVPGGGCLSRAWLPEKPGQRRRKAASHDLGAGRRWASRREGEAEKSISPLPLLPTTTHQSEKNKYISLFSGPALHIYPPFPPPTHKQDRAHRNKGGGGGGYSHQPRRISPAWPGRLGLAPAASEREGRGFLWAPLPRPSLLQSGAAASLNPCAPGPRDSHHLPPAPAPSFGLPGLAGAGAR